MSKYKGNKYDKKKLIWIVLIWIFGFLTVVSLVSIFVCTYKQIVLNDVFVFSVLILAVVFSFICLLVSKKRKKIMEKDIDTIRDILSDTPTGNNNDIDINFKKSFNTNSNNTNSNNTNITKIYIFPNFFSGIVVILAIVVFIYYLIFAPVYKTVSFYVEDEIYSIQRIIEEKSVSIPEEPTKEGYIFKEWQYEKTSYDFNSTVDQSITLYATWEIINYNITYYLDGEIYIDSRNPTTYTVEDEFELNNLSYTEEIEGYLFQKYWYTWLDDDLNEISGIQKGSTGDINLIGKLNCEYMLENYTIEYEYDELNWENTNPKSYTLEDEILFNSLTFNSYEEGYEYVTEFEGWYSDSTYENQVLNIEKGTMGNMIVYGKTTVIETVIIYQINYEGIEGWENLNPESYTIEDEIELIDIHSEFIDEDGYTHVKYFYGWYTDESYTTQVTTIEKGTTGNMTLYAKTSEEVTYSDGLEYSLLSDNTYSVVGIGNCTDLEIIIPDLYNGLPVTTIGANAFLECSNITNVIISDTIISIGNSAFSGCSSLTNVVIPNTIESIGYRALYGCSSLESLTIPFIGDGDTNTHFGYIFGATTFDSNSNYVPESLINVTITNVEYLESNAFYNCQNIESIQFDANITYISENVFKNCISLQHVYYTATIEDWCNITFENQYSTPMFYATQFYMLDGYGKYYEVTEVVLPNTISEINEYSFYKFSNLTSITISQSAVSIGYAAFGGCDNLESITIPFLGESLNGTSNTHFGYIFGATTYDNNSSYIPETLTSVTITTSTIINSNAFYNCDSIVNLQLYDSITTIEKDAFKNCTNLEKLYYTGTEYDWCNINFENEYSTPMYYASCFYLLNINNKEYYNVEKIEILDTITNINAYTFYDFNSLKEIVLPSSITNISANVFYNCINLQKVYYNGTIEEWCNITFENEYSNPIYYATYFYMLDEDGEYYEVTEIVIPDTVTEIKAYAFYGFTNVKSVTMTESVTSIGIYAFSGCNSLESITLSFVGATLNGTSNTHFGYIFGDSSYSISSSSTTSVPSSLTSVTILGGTIGSYAFQYRSYITSVTIGENVTSIGSSAFYNCTNLQNVYYNAANATTTASPSYAPFIYSGSSEGCELIIGDSVESIGDYMFYGFTNVTSVTIAKTVEKIGSYAFQYCSSLEKIYYNAANASTPSIDYTPFSNSGSSDGCEIVIGESVESIGDYMFYGFTNMQSVTIGENVTSIGSSAFYNCTNLQNVYYKGTIEDWCNITFSNSSANPMYYATNLYMLDEDGEYYEVTEIVIPDTVTEIKAYAFYGFTNITSVTMTESVTSIGAYSFFNCSNLQNVYYNGTIEEWCNITFENEYSTPMYYATNLYMLDEDGEYYEVTEIVISDTVTEIKAYVFYGCNSLESILIPSSVKSIGNYAFGNCANLTIYCEISNTTENWSEYWNSSSCPVLWSVVFKDGICISGVIVIRDNNNNMPTITDDGYDSNHYDEIIWNDYFDLVNLKSTNYTNVTISMSIYVDGNQNTIWPFTKDTAHIGYMQNDNTDKTLLISEISFEQEDDPIIKLFSITTTIDKITYDTLCIVYTGSGYAENNFDIGETYVTITFS